MSAENLNLYKQYLEQLHQLELEGNKEEEQEAICELMDTPGNGMTFEEIKESNAYSAMLWEEYDKIMEQKKKSNESKVNE